MPRSAVHQRDALQETYCGQELYDVIEVTDPVTGLNAARRRVAGLELRYATGKRPVYEQRIVLGGA